MIIDVLENLGKYASAIPHTAEIVRYFGTVDTDSLKPGKYPIVGESAYMVVMEYLTVSESAQKWESHRKYIDVQILFRGSEYMSVCPVSAFGGDEPYVAEIDATLYETASNEFSRLFVPARHFCVFYPGEAHRPGCHLLTESAVLKAVIKIEA